MAIQNVTVMGAGVMGRGIAYVSALAGFHTTLVDISEEQLKEAYDHAEKTTQKGIKREKLTEVQAQSLLDNLHTSLSFESTVETAIY